MSAVRQYRYPLAPLLRLIPRVIDPVSPVHDHQPLRVLEDVLAVSNRTVWRWHAAGGLPEAAADRAAVALGLHPLNVWPDFHHDCEVAS